MPCSPTCPVSYPSLAPRPRGGALRDARSWAFEPRNRGEHLRLRPSQVLDEVDLRPGQPRHVHRLDVLAAHEKMQRILVLAELVALLDHLLEQTHQLRACPRSAFAEANALADAVPRLGNHLLAAGDHPIALRIDLDFTPRVGKPPIHVAGVPSCRPNQST